MYINGPYSYGWYNPEHFDWNGHFRHDHGGHAKEHREEMTQIATAVVNELVPKIAAEIYNQAIENLIGALEYDIQTCVHIAINSFEEIYKSDKVEKMCSDAIMKELKKKISVNDLKIKL